MDGRIHTETGTLRQIEPEKYKHSRLAKNRKTGGTKEGRKEKERKSYDS